MTKAGPRDGDLAGTCSARTISTMCAIHGAASQNIPAISITYRRTNAGHPATTSRRILFTSGARTCRPNSRSITKAARVDAAALNRAGPSVDDDLDLLAQLEPVMRAEAIERPEALERMIGRRHAMRELFDRIVYADRNHLQMQRLHLLAFLQSHAAKTHNRFAKSAIHLRGPCFGSKNKAVDFTAKAHSV